MPLSPSDPPILIIGAFWREVSAVASGLVGRRPYPIGHGRAVSGRSFERSVIVAAGGIGRDRSTSTAREILDREDASVMVNVGSAGALADGLPAPTLVLADLILHNDAEVIPSEDLLADAGGILERTGLPYRRGRLVTVDCPVRRSGEKREMGRRRAALAVEMESFHLARLARERGVPFLSIKAILDTVDRDLPDATFLLSASGRPSALRVVLYLLRRPREVGTILSLARSEGRGRAAIADFSRAFLEEWRQGRTG